VAPGAPVDVRVDASPAGASGTVTAINAAANSQYALLPSGNPSGQFIKVTQRVAVRVELQDGDPLLRPGMMATVDIRAR
jgi:membrane fusion protein (multidrug efflux system)